MLNRRRNLLETRNGRFLTFSILYISEGIPYGFTSVAMVAFMRQQGVSLELIGAFVAALFLPWAFKWAWAPLIDLIKLHRLGGRRAWIIFCTGMMILTLLLTAMVDFKEDFRLLLAMIVLNNLFCSTQDVAIDSLAETDAVVVTLFYYDELSLDEIATVTGLSNSNIRIKLHRSRKKMYQVICAYLKSEVSSIL